MTLSRSSFLPALVVVLAWMIPLSVYHGVILGGDDVLYARLAADLAAGKPSFFINTHTCRFGFIAPLAAFYAGFGIKEWTTMAFPVACTILTVLVAAFGAHRLYGRNGSIWAALLSALNPILYRNGTEAMADVPAGFFYGVFSVGWLLLVMDKVRYRSVWGALSGLACAWALITRLSTAPMIILTLPGFLFLAHKKGALRTFPLLPFLLGGCFLGLPYLAFLWWHTGNPLYFLSAESGGYNFPGAAWVKPLEGLRFWMRLSGFSIVRASVEGFLFATFPLVMVGMGLTLGKATPFEEGRFTRLYLLVAILSPLAVLSHFSTSFIHWYPVHLDLRFGSPTIIPVAILVAGLCVELPGARFSRFAKLLAVAALSFTGILLVAAFLRQDWWTCLGAGASFVVGLSLLGVGRGPKVLLPGVLIAVLALNWLYYRQYESREIVALNTATRLEAEAVLRNPPLPILTDPSAALYLPYLFGFDPAARIATWRGEGGVPWPGYWSEHLDAPWREPYLLVWYPKRAKVQTEREGGTLPEWLHTELAKGTLMRPLPDEAEIPANVFDLPRPYSGISKSWPKSGIYIIEGLDND